MDRAEGWFMCRVGFVETVRAVGLAGGLSAVRAVREEWHMLDVVEVSVSLAEEAVELAIEHDLRSLDALHLAAALTIPHDDLALATWDRRLHRAARSQGLQLIPDVLD